MNTNAITSMMSNSTSSTSSNAAASGPQADKDLFMKLLVAQLKNQDPMSPQDGAAFVAQLAQFNSLEQLTNIRQSIEELVAAMQRNPDPSTNN
jgi:flagellar basal-body rod modification protein FlgD